MIATVPKTRAIDRLRKSMAEAWAPRSRTRPVDWVPARIRLNPQYEAGDGPYELASRPWFRGILEALDDPNVRRIRLKASPQIGKTLFLQAILLYLAENDPATGMVILPDRDSAIEFRDRLYALAAESGFRVPPKWKWNTRHMDVGDMRVYLAWPKSRQRLRGRRCKYVFRSEIDVYESPKRVGDAITSSDQRVKAYKRYLTVDESSPVPDPSRIEQLENDSNRNRWWAECPHCGLWQHVRFFPQETDEGLSGGVRGYRDDLGNMLDADRARDAAYYECETGCKITIDQKTAFIASGKWVPAGCWIGAQGQITGDSKSSDRIGFHLWAIHSNQSWGEMAAEWVRAVTNGTVPDFWQNTLGLAHRTRGKMPSWKELGERARGSHVRGTVPAAAWFLTAAGDVQENEIYVTVRAWGDKRTSWLVDWFVFQRGDGDEGELIKSDFAQIAEAVLERSWPVVGGLNPRGKSQLPVALFCIDANYRTLDVHNWAKSLKTNRVRTVRGDVSVKGAQRYRKTVVEHSKREDSVKYEGGLELWGINVDAFKVDLATRFRSDPAKPGMWWVTEDCLEVGQYYLQSVVNEIQVITRGKDGRPKLEWRERDHTVGHDFWDTEVYSSACAQMIVDQFPGAPGWDASRWPLPKGKDKVTATNAAPLVQRDFE